MEILKSGCVWCIPVTDFPISQLSCNLRFLICRRRYGTIHGYFEYNSRMHLSNYCFISVLPTTYIVINDSRYMVREVWTLPSSFLGRSEARACLVLSDTQPPGAALTIPSAALWTSTHRGENELLPKHIRLPVLSWVPSPIATGLTLPLPSSNVSSQP